MSNINFRFWQDVTKLLVDRQDGTYAERVEAYPPKVLMTDGDGPYARLRVDPGQTGFWAGREFRTFYEFSIPDGQTSVIKAVTPINVVLYSFSVELTLAELKVKLIAGGTEGGTFSTVLPVLPTNAMTTASGYTSQVTMSAGGTHTGGTVYDVLDIDSGSVAAKAVVQTATEDQPLGFPAGTYYITLQNTNGATATGIFKARWEERP